MRAAERRLFYAEQTSTRSCSPKCWRGERQTLSRDARREALTPAWGGFAGPPVGAGVRARLSWRSAAPRRPALASRTPPAPLRQPP